MNDAEKYLFDIQGFIHLKVRPRACSPAHQQLAGPGDDPSAARGRCPPAPASASPDALRPAGRTASLCGARRCRES